MAHGPLQAVPRPGKRDLAGETRGRKATGLTRTLSTLAGLPKHKKPRRRCGRGFGSPSGSFFWPGRKRKANSNMTETKKTKWTAFAIALLACAPSASVGEFDKLAAQLSAAAKSRGRARVAILPFQVIGGRGATSGRIVSERLVAPIMAAGQVE